MTATPPITIDADDVQPALGRAKFHAETAERTGVPGVATGLAVTGVGGDVLFIEATTMDGEGLTLTGQLGDVMKESAQIALSYVQPHADELGVDPAAVQRRVHLHVPAGGIPKDGPSAGITMTTALVSLLTGRTVKAGVGMTGEVTLQGRVLPIGGVKQKVLAAQRAGLDTVILPQRNGPDLDDVPEAVREVMTFHLVDDVRDVLDARARGRRRSRRRSRPDGRPRPALPPRGGGVSSPPCRCSSSGDSRSSRSRVSSSTPPRSPTAASPATARYALFDLDTGFGLTARRVPELLFASARLVRRRPA